jgi:hypothetical protein
LTFFAHRQLTDTSCRKDVSFRVTVSELIPQNTQMNRLAGTRHLMAWRNTAMSSHSEKHKTNHSGHHQLENVTFSRRDMTAGALQRNPNRIDTKVKSTCLVDSILEAVAVVVEETFVDVVKRLVGQTMQQASLPLSERIARLLDCIEHDLADEDEQRRREAPKAG